MGYIDTSVLTAYYCPEPLSEIADQHIRSVSRPLISWLVDVELHSALAKKVRMEELEARDAQRIQQLFRGHCAGDYFHTEAVLQRDFVQAREWLGSHDVALRTLDALHLAVAHRCGAPVVTSDAQLRAAGDQLGMTITLLRVDN